MDAVFGFANKFLARMLSSSLVLCVVVFNFYALGDASLCARRLARRLLVRFVRGFFLLLFLSIGTGHVLPPT